MSFIPYSKLHTMVAIVTLAKDCMLYNHNNPTIKKAPNHCCARLKIMPQTNNFEPQPF
jgi:hypothetical protein